MIMPANNLTACDEAKEFVTKCGDKYESLCQFKDAVLTGTAFEDQDISLAAQDLIRTSLLQERNVVELMTDANKDVYYNVALLVSCFIDAEKMHAEVKMLLGSKAGQSIMARIEHPNREEILDLLTELYVYHPNSVLTKAIENALAHDAILTGDPVAILADELRLVL